MLFYHIIRTIYLLFVYYEGVRKVACVCACLDAWGDQNLTLGWMSSWVASPLCFLGQDLSLNLECIDWLDKLIHELWDPTISPSGICGCWWSNSGACACTEGVLSTEQAPQSHVESFQTEAGGGAWLIECSHLKDPGLSHQHCWEEGVLALVLILWLFVKLWECLRKNYC